MDPETTDMTAKARIRNSALELFARLGEPRVSIRKVAAHAEVTAGLIQHHYRSKEQLRAAVDEYVVSMFARAIAAADARSTDAAAARDAAVRTMLEDNPLIVDYLRRDALDPATGGNLIARLTDLTAGEVAAARAAGTASTGPSPSQQVVAVMIRQLGQLLLEPLIASIWSQLEGDQADPADRPRLVVDIAGRR